MRERLEDIDDLVRHFVALGQREGLAPKSFDADALSLMRAHDWPGNVRELQNLVQRVELLVDGDEVGGDAIRRWVQPLDAALPEDEAPRPDVTSAGGFVGRTLAEMERDLIRLTLDQCGGNRTRTAQVLGIGVRTLFNKLKVYEEPAVAAQA